MNNGNGKLATLKDDSIAPHPRGGGMLKREKYRWADTTTEGAFAWIDKHDLRIDYEYQREEVSEAKVATIAREFNWRLFGALSVARRPDGDLAVFDGGHRLRGAMKRDDVQSVPCMVFDVVAIKDEAQTFLDKNTLTNSVSAYHKHRAGVKAERPESIAAREILAKHGYAPSRVSGTQFTTKAIALVERIVATDSDLADAVVGVAAEVAGGEQMSASLVRALFEAARKAPEVLSPHNAKKLMDAGQEVLTVEMNRHKNLVSKGGGRVEAEALVKYLNKGRRTRTIEL